tara:strand:- start:205 stop:828 length:624 start_codon:yes stop_codon:yes gene_type:complete
MKRIYSLLSFFPIIILGCTPNVIEDNKVKQKIDNLDMDIFSNKGVKIYSITSPYSSFDKNKQKFQLKKTIINIFNGEETKYIIKSDKSTLSNNNKILELKGNVKLKTIGKEEGILLADDFIWNIDENNYLLRGNIRFENKNIILNSAKAKLGLDNIIEFFNPVKYVIKGNKNEDKYEINSENAYYNIESESLSFKANEKRVRSIIYF